MYKNDYSLHSGPTRRTWLAAGAALAAVLVLVGLIAVACNARSPQETSADAAGGASASPDATGDGSEATAGLGSGDGGTDSGDGGTDGGGSGDDAGSGDDGGGADSGDDGDGDGGADPVEPSAKDCVSFDPTNLTVEAHGDAWRLMDGGHAMKLFDTKVDADDGLKVARNWTKSCFIGRDNDREDRYRYIIGYWEEPSGLPLGPAPSTFDCVSYDPDNLAVSPALTGDGVWVVRDGGLVIVALASQADAERARIVASGFTRKCVIGGDNDRPDPYRYLMHYWRS